MLWQELCEDKNESKQERPFACANCEKAFLCKYLIRNFGKFALVGWKWLFTPSDVTKTLWRLEWSNQERPFACSNWEKAF